MITGQMKDLAKGGFDATLSTMQFDMAVRIVPSETKAAENHPDYHVTFMNGKGRSIRIGAMWIQESRAGNPYYAISITGRTGRTIRMNAVRNADSATGLWEIIPLAGGTTEPVALSGTLETLDDGNFSGSVGSFDFDFNFIAVENSYKERDDHPDYHIECRSPAGKIIRMGSIWKATSDQTGNAYLSMRFFDPVTGAQYRANGVRNDATPDGQWEIIPLADRAPAYQAAAA